MTGVRDVGSGRHGAERTWASHGYWGCSMRTCGTCRGGPFHRSGLGVVRQVVSVDAAAAESVRRVGNERTAVCTYRVRKGEPSECN